MKKIFKRLFAGISALAVMAINILPVSASSNYFHTDYFGDTEIFKEYAVLDDKGMINDIGLKNVEGYKILYREENPSMVNVDPIYGQMEFILNEGLKCEDVNDRVTEIFEEFYPADFLVDLYPDDYVGEIYEPSLSHGICGYTVRISSETICSATDERVVKAKQYSMAMMKKLYEENLICAFYDFGEAYSLTRIEAPYDIMYYAGETILENNSFYDYRSSHAIYSDDLECVNSILNEYNVELTSGTYSSGEGYYQITAKEGSDYIDCFNAAASVYEKTSIPIAGWLVNDFVPGTAYRNNALEDYIAENPVETTTTPNEAETTTTTTTTVTTTPVETVTSTSTQPAETKPVGDADNDMKITVRDCSFIAIKISKGEAESLPESADFNGDKIVNIRDAAAIANYLAKK